MSRIQNLLQGIVILASTGLLLLAEGCVEATVIGSDLLNQDLQVVGFTDTFRLKAVTRTEDSVLIHSASAGGQVIRQSIGNLNDPYFGKSSSVVSSQVFLNGVGSDFLAYNIDSVILSLTYVSSQTYGQIDVPVSMNVYKLSQTLDPVEDYWSNAVIERETEVAGALDNFIPRPSDSLTITRPGDTVLAKPHLRIPMSESFIQDMTSQLAAVFETQDSFSTWLMGFQIEMSQGENTMLAFDLNDAQSGLTVYYSSSDSTIYRSYRFIFRNPSLFDQNEVQFAGYQHDYTGSVAESFIDNAELSDSLMFVQSMSGLNAELEFTGLEDVQNVVVNKAELEVFMADLPDNDLMLYPMVERLQTRTLNEDSLLVNSRDIILALQVQNIDAFGGEAVMVEGGVYRYTMNVTAVVQDIMSGRTANKVFLSSFAKQNQARRVILYGPGHSQYPTRLKIAFTRTD